MIATTTTASTTTASTTMVKCESKAGAGKWEENSYTELSIQRKLRSKQMHTLMPCNTGLGKMLQKLHDGMRYV